MLLTNRNLLFLFLVTLIGVVVAPFTGQPFDMMVWFKTGELMSRGENIYLPNDHIGYLPLWAYWALASYHAYALSGHNHWLWSLFVKLPLIMANVFLPITLAGLVSKLHSRADGQMALKWILSFGFLIYSGPIWGQLNVLTALLTFLALTDAIRGKPWRSGFWLGVGMTLKPNPALAYFPLAIFYYKTHGRSSFAAFTLVSVLIPLSITFATLRFFGWWEYPLVLTIYFQIFSLQCEECVAPTPLMNIWNAFGGITSPDWLWFIPAVWLLASAFLIYFWLKKTELGHNGLFIWTAQIYLLFIATFPRLPETAITDLLPILVLIALGHGRKYLTLAIVLQILAIGFSFANHGLHIFNPAWEAISKDLVPTIEAFYKANSSITSTARIFIGTAVSVLAIFFTLKLMNGPNALFKKK